MLAEEISGKKCRVGNGNKSTIPKRLFVIKKMHCRDRGQAFSAYSQTSFALAVTDQPNYQLSTAIPLYNALAKIKNLMLFSKKDTRVFKIHKICFVFSKGFIRGGSLRGL